MSYQEKIQTISQYFNISDDAAKYIYHRRRRGDPWKHKKSIRYLEWSIQLQNGLVKADTMMNFDWTALSFGNEVDMLSSFGVDISTESNNPYRNESMVVKIKTSHVADKSQKKRDNQNYDTNESNDIKKVNESDDDWTVVKNKKTTDKENKLLKQMGLLPSKNLSFLVTRQRLATKFVKKNTKRKYAYSEKKPREEIDKNTDKSQSCDIEKKESYINKFQVLEVE